MAAIKKLFSRLLNSVVLPAGIIVVSLYIFNSLADITFVIASVMAFAVGFFVIYLVFKYWINTDIKDETPQQQMMRYMIVFIVNMAINTEIVYFLVTYIYVPLLVAQTVAAVVVAYESYFAYRSLVFRVDTKQTIADEISTNASAVAAEYANK